MITRSKLKQQYISRQAEKKHKKKVRRKKKKYFIVFVQPKPKAPKDRRTKRIYYAPYTPKTLPYSDAIEHIFNVRKELVRKYHPINFFKKEIKIDIPEHFSLVDQCSSSYKFIFDLFFILYHQKYRVITIDYKYCRVLDLDAQVLMDVILKEFIDHYHKCRNAGKPINHPTINLANYNAPEIAKILFSIGSFKIHRKINIDVPHITPYHLCIGSKSNGLGDLAGSEKEVHVTELIDYIQNCLSTVNRRLSIDARSELCQVIGEVLINAEEHSTTPNRYSIGFFEDSITDDKTNKQGIFNLAIFNFGKSIYEKFKEPGGAPEHIVNRMQELSSHYTKMSFFHDNFKEETLWTLYALQEGVTSIADKKRGNGSIRFIDSFFKLKGSGAKQDEVSKLTIISGNTKIMFNGEYGIQPIIKNGNKFNIMAFNKNNNIEERPDKKYVTFADHYFPGTMIVAKICISEDDLVQTNES